MRVLFFLLFAVLLAGCVEVSNQETAVNAVDESITSTNSQESNEQRIVSTENNETVPFTGEGFDTSEYDLVDKFEAVDISNSSFRSSFFKGDETGEKIMSGEIPNYSIKDFEGSVANNRKSFAFKVLNALRMLGYKLSCDFGYYTCWHNFLADNNFSQTDVVIKDTLEKLDNEIAEVEMRDSLLARGFPLYEEFIEENLQGEPSKNHLVALFSLAFNLLPSHLVGDAAAFRNYFVRQLPEGSGTDYAIKCNSESQCIISFRSSYYSSLTNVSNVNNVFLIRDDFGFPAVIIHEYAHYLDAKVYDKNEELKQGVVNTTSFYSITYDINSEYEHEIGWKYYLPRENFTAREEEFFVSDYSVGWEREDLPGYYTAYEDFAESFAMYILAGNVFRCKAQSHPILMQKYEWLKENVFDGIEYNYEKAGQCNEFYSNYQHYILNSPFSKFSLDEVEKLE